MIRPSVLWYRMRAYLQYLIQAQSNLYIHSPFVFKLFNEVILPARQAHAQFDEIEALRKRLSILTTPIPSVDFGAGTTLKQHTVGDIARQAAITPKYGRLLHYLAQFMQVQQALELGTSFGFGTQYLSVDAPNRNIVTLEGNPHIATYAQANFDWFDKSNITILRGAFTDNLEQCFDLLNGKIDLLYIDGHHNSEALLTYFNQCLPYLHENSVVVVDDINWNQDMQAGWQKLRQSVEVRCSINLYRMGLLFFKPEFKQQVHFTLRY